MDQEKRARVEAKRSHFAAKLAPIREKADRIPFPAGALRATAHPTRPEVPGPKGVVSRRPARGSYTGEIDVKARQIPTDDV